MGTIAELCNSRSKKWAKEKATQLKEAAIRNPFQKALYHSHILSLHMYIDLLLQYKEHLSKLAAEIDALAKEVEEYEIIQSIPGIGEKALQRLSPKLGKLNDSVLPKNLWRSLELTQVSLNLANSEPL